MSKAIAGAAMLAGAVGIGAALFLDPELAFSPFLDKLMIGLALGGVSMEAGAIADALTQNRAMAITTRHPAAFRQLIYGERRVGGVMVYESTTGSHYDQYNMVIVLATHEIDSIVNLYLDGRQVHWDGSNANGNTTRNGVNFGGNASGGTFIGPGGQHYNFDGLVYCEARFGDQASGDVITGLTANDPNWAAGANGSPYLGGCAYVYLKVEYDQAMFPSFPEIKFTIRGKNDIYDPRLAADPAVTTLARPTTLLNGWDADGHVGAYEEGIDQNYGWGLNSGTTLPYANPDNAFDGNDATSATALITGSHQYIGCIWSFATISPPFSLYLNVLSEVPAINGAARSAGIWYSLDGGTNWTEVYNASYRGKQWDSIPLSPSQDASKIQVMAFMDSHDDMDHNVFDIQLSSGPMSSTGQKGYSTNWALIAADVLTDLNWGLGDVGAVNEDQLIAAANVCDEQVALAAGGTESRYTAHFPHDTSVAPGNVLEMLMPAAAGRISRIGGEWFIWPAYWQGSSFSFDESELAGPIGVTATRKFRELFNRVRGTYIAANYPYNASGDLYDSNGWFDGSIQNNYPFAFQPTNYPEYAEDALHGFGEDVLLGEDGGIFLPKEVVQNCVLSVAQAQRCAKIILLRNRLQQGAELTMHLDAWQMQPLDVLELTFPLMGWSSKQFEVSSTRIGVEKDANDEFVVRFRCTLQEADSSVYEWSTREELSVYDVPSNPAVGVPYIVAAPTSLVLESDASTALSNAGILMPRILASWTAPADSTVTQIEIQYQAVGDAGWTTAGNVSDLNTSFYIGGVTAGVQYNVRIASLRASGVMSAWTQAAPITAWGSTGPALNELVNAAGAPITLGGKFIYVG